MAHPLSAVLARPDSTEARTVLDTHIGQTLDQDPVLDATVQDMLAGFFAGSCNPATPRR